jgi:hypothetical protein
MPAETPPPEPTHASRFRATLLRVLVVQAVAIALLGLIQILYDA